MATVPATSTNTASSFGDALPVLPRLRPLSAYSHHYSRTVNFTDTNAAEHLDSAVIGRYIADATMQFWMEVLAFPRDSHISLVEWLAQQSGYDRRGVSQVMLNNMEQRTRYTGEAFCRETVNIDVTVRGVSRSTVVLAVHLYVVRGGERPRPQSVAVSEVTAGLVDPARKKLLPISPEFHGFLSAKCNAKSTDGSLPLLASQL